MSTVELTSTPCAAVSVARAICCSVCAATTGTGLAWNVPIAGHDMPQERLLMADPLPAFLQQLCFERRQQECPLSSGEVIALSATGNTQRNSSQNDRHVARTR